ncbi:hypothetical protein N7495_005252 [Penicillium taxi]|uniref:uncharacterized protein n=1 Tax=Penicillium taxi TaxID=168475 RepID=UPI002545744E|nr:uncharacterized protein N7495_005252 [Penicillium taxi]KAJ5893561.1 hypothetical protein N7495_005252 [Penicillium taxi]
MDSGLDIVEETVDSLVISQVKSDFAKLGICLCLFRRGMWDNMLESTVIEYYIKNMSCGTKIANNKERRRTSRWVDFSVRLASMATIDSWLEDADSTSSLSEQHLN